MTAFRSRGPVPERAPRRTTAPSACDAQGNRCASPQGPSSNSCSGTSAGARPTGPCVVAAAIAKGYAGREVVRGSGTHGALSTLLMSSPPVSMLAHHCAQASWLVRCETIRGAGSIGIRHIANPRVFPRPGPPTDYVLVSRGNRS